MTAEERKWYVLEDLKMREEDIEKEKDRILSDIRSLKYNIENAVKDIENDNTELNSFCDNSINLLLDIMRLSGGIRAKRASISTAHIIFPEEKGEQK